MPGRAFGLIAALLLLLPPAHADAPRFSGELGYGHDSNANRARRPVDERASSQARAALSVDSTWRPSMLSALTLQAGVEGQHDFDFDGLSNAKAGGLARLFLRPSGTFFAPTFVFTGGAAWWEFDNQLRDSAEYRGSVHLVEQLTTHISARIGFSAVWRGADSAVFDLDARSGVFDLDWTVHPRLLLYAGYQYREGDLVATGAAAPAAAVAYASDDAFGRPGDVVYRIAADAQVGTFGFNYALTSSLALDAQGQFIQAEADAGSHYERWLSTVGLLFRF